MYKKIKDYFINMDKVKYMYAVDEDFWENRERAALVIVFGYKDELSIPFDTIFDAEDVIKQLTGESND